MGRDGSDDEAVTEVSVEVDTSSIAEITISATGQAPITVAADAASPADAEPRTLEPRLLVRGLAPSLAGPPSTQPAPEIRAVARGREDDEDSTARNVEDRLLAVVAKEQRARGGSKASFGPIITPSEPFRVTSPTTVDPLPPTLDGAPTANTLSSASLVVPSVSSSSRRADTDPDLSEPTAKRAPVHSEVEDETVTDAMRTLRAEPLATKAPVPAAGSAPLAVPPVARSPAAPARPEEPEEETKTQTQQEVAALVATLGVLPKLADDAEDREIEKAVGGGTMRMDFPKTPSAIVYGDEALRQAPPAPPATAPLPAPPPAPPPPPPPPAPPAAALATARTRPAKKRRGSGRVLTFLFLISVAAAGGALYRSKFRPAWMNLRRAPPPATAPVVAPSSAPLASETTDAGAANLDASAADASAADGAALDASAANLDASAGVSPAPSASASASPSPSASATGRGRGRGRPPRR